MKGKIDLQRKEDAMDIDLDVTEGGEEPGEEQSNRPGSSSGSEVVIEKASFVNKLNKLLPLIGAKKIVFEKIGRSESYMRNTFDEITRQLAKNLFEIAPCTDEHAAEQNAGHEMQQLKDEFAKTMQRDTRTNFFSVLPGSWSARKNAKEFNTSINIA